MKEIMIKHPCMRTGILSGYFAGNTADNMSEADIDKIKSFAIEVSQFWHNKPEASITDLYHEALLYKIDREKLSGEAAKKAADVFASNLYNLLYYQYLYSLGLAHFAEKPYKFDFMTYAVMDRSYDPFYDLSKYI